MLTITGFAAAQELGVRVSFGEDTTLRCDVLGDFAQRAADGKSTVPVAHTLPLKDWRAALDVIRSQRSNGKVVLLPASAGAFASLDPFRQGAS